jgi:hypothetical protein
MSTKRKIYLACMWIFAIGSIIPFALDLYWHSVSPHCIDIAAGRTYELSGRGGSVFVTPLAGHLLVCLQVVPMFFLVIGMLTWARAWREWK